MRGKSSLGLALIGLVLGLATSRSFAQDHNYWVNQFGSRSALLSGAVVGGVRDTSAGYYNPGALGMIDNPSLSVSANAIRHSSLSLDNGAGTGSDLDSDDTTVIPLLVSGIWRPEGWCECHTFGYSLLTRTNNSIDMTDRRDARFDAITNPLFPGDEDYIGQFNFNSDLDEYWGGLSYAYSLSDTFSLGFTNFLAIRNQSATEQILARGVGQVLSGVTDSIHSYDYYNVRALWKVGAAADLAPVKLGFTLTTPSVNLFGRGDVSRDITVSNIDFNGDGLMDNLVADDRQKGLDSEYNTPLSIAAGLEWDVFDGMRVMGSVEWFTPVGRYDVLDPSSRDFVRPTGQYPQFNSKDFLEVSDAADNVVNFAAGLEQVFNETYTGIVSFRSDYSYGQTYRGEGLAAGVGDWNLYHVAVGGIYHQENSEFSLGVEYSFGEDNDVSQVANLSEGNEQTLLVGIPGDSKVDYQAISVILGYTYFFR